MLVVRDDSTVYVTRRAGDVLMLRDTDGDGKYNPADSPPDGVSKVVRIRFDEQGNPTEYTDLVSGFLVNDNQAQFSRVVGLAPYPDGSILISDDTGGVIYRLSYGG